MATLNMLALLAHTFLAHHDDAYRLVRARLSTHQTFFGAVRALLRYVPFPFWEALMDFMIRGLAIGPNTPAEACP